MTWTALLLCLWTFAPTTQTPTVRITGDGLKPLTLTTADLAAMPRTSIPAAAHDQKGTYEGVSMRELLTRAGVPDRAGLRGPELAKIVIVTGADGYRVSYGIAEFDPGFTDRVAILADKLNGGPLPANALPFQLILSGEKRPARWVRQLVSIEIRTPSVSP